MLNRFDRNVDSFKNVITTSVKKLFQQDKLSSHIVEYYYNHPLLHDIDSKSTYEEYHPSTKKKAILIQTVTSKCQIFNCWTVVTNGIPIKRSICKHNNFLMSYRIMPCYCYNIRCSLINIDLKLNKTKAINSQNIN